ncbi:MAG: carboxypeptidase-like regulatory domain-containing protein [Bryobacteraceae bacterium]
MGRRATPSLNGTVKDLSGAVVPDVHIVLINLETNIVQTTVTNSAGRYSLVNIASVSTRSRYKRQVLLRPRTPASFLDFTLGIGKTI